MAFNRKGNVWIEGITIIVVLFIFAVFILPFYDSAVEINNDIQNSSELSPTAKAKLDDAVNKVPAIFDYGSLLILIFLWMGALIGAYYIDASPVFFIITVIIFGVLVMVSAEFTNFYLDYRTSFTYSAFPITDFIFNNLAMWILIIGSTVSIVMFGKMQR